MHSLAINAWINEVALYDLLPVPEPPLTFGDVPISPPTTPQKRDGSRFSPPAPLSQQKKARRVPLSSLSLNQNQMPRQMRSTEKAVPARTPSPRKRPATRSMSPQKVDQGDPDQTPRPARSLRSQNLAYRKALSLPPAGASAGAGADGDDDEVEIIEIAPRTPSVTSSATSNSKRSTSPVKRAVALQDLSGGIFFTAVTDTAEELGSLGQDLWWDLEATRSGAATIPRLLWDTDENFRADLGGGKLPRFLLDADDSRELEVLQRELEMVRKLNRRSRRCEKDGDPEAEWNNRVHSPLLDMVFDSNEEGESVEYRCMVSDKIDTQWLPRDSSGAAISARMVDYGIVLNDTPKHKLQRDETLQQRLLRHPELATPSINHTNRHGIRNNPIAISIETKTISRTEEEARVQLAIWISAQIQRIRFILDQGDSDTDLLTRMAFPLLFVQSSRWTIMFARLDPISMTRLDIYTGARLGDTSTLRGTYSLLKGLRQLRKFIEEGFCQWWHDILDQVEVVDEHEDK